MITVTINDPELEKMYRIFNENDEEFSKFLSLRASANNLGYGLDAQMIEAAYDEAEVEGDSGYTIDEAFDMLKEKHGIH
jgi:hypothetical protein